MMYIEIQDNQKYTNDFLIFLRNRMFMVGMDYLNSHRQKLTAITSYLQGNLFTGVRKPTAEQVIIAGLRNFKTYKASGKLIISLDEVVRVPLIDDLALESVCRLIDQGNLELNPFQIFTYVFNYIKNNVARIYVDYTFGVPA